MTRLPIVDFKTMEVLVNLGFQIIRKKAHTFFIAIPMGGPPLFPTIPEEAYHAHLYVKFFVKSS